MNSFVSNKLFLDNETVAEQLRRARQDKKIKLKQVAKKLNINEKYLASLEKGEYDKLPRGVYGKNFLREYANWLGLDYQELAKAYNGELNIYQPQGAKELFAKQVVKKQYLWAIPKITRNILIIAIVAICFVYLGWRFNKIISPPDLLIYSPVENLITVQSTVEVLGKTEAEAQIIINNEIVLSDTSGNFSKTVSLKDGLNNISITASKKYGRSKTITRQILVKTEETSTIAN
ncbi:hypothetical protein CO116_01450 [Candidatus Falkowbacteria bacterium CG_4_9_14_3_um_filter_38_19]|uniref:HTH cro/C1-type domain-containing protein n=2 Tax=Candidatus Falkowiibacteriota TaxID=1752728 RepID=A0A2M6WRT3_9BACT|nr:MAG: hypothetical protein COT96_01090 [Candidatus Falkowbacteria bacterium CG10_big_fil_rev_8_21_14_0_10_38_22]PJB17095.1 MAG: hypothetical protein CO116_01450 [Candidatus Falkowbacteria bacterium CG_4_9_14_3_um_filter_38_19]